MTVDQQFDELLEELDLAHPASDLIRIERFLDDHAACAGVYLTYAHRLRYFCRFQESREALKVAEYLVGGPHPILKVVEGQSYFEAGRLGLALRHIRKAVELAPSSAEPQLWLARCWRRQGLVQDAERCLRQIRHSAEDLRAEVALELALCLRAQEKWGQALRWFRRAAREGKLSESQGPIQDLSEARRVGGWSLHDLQHRHGGAVTELTAGRRLQKLQPESAVPLAKQAQALAELDRPGEALAYVRRWKKVIPGHPFGLVLRGTVLKAGGRYASAAKQYLQAAAQAKGTIPWIYAGACLARMGELVQAEACHREATQRPGDPDEAWYNLALVLRAQGRYVEALKCARRAVELDPYFDGPHLLDLEKAIELSGAHA